MLLSAAFLLVARARTWRSTSRRRRAGTHWPTPALLVALLVGYVLLLSALGYALATTIFFWLAAWLLGSERRCATPSSASLLGVVTSYAFSQWLNVQLPTGPWGV